MRTHTWWWVLIRTGGMAHRLGAVCTHCRQLLSRDKRFLLRPLRVVSTVQVLSSEADPIPPPPSDGASKTYPAKIHTLVQEISHLSLLETAQLNELLKTTLNIPDAPVMMGAMPTAAATQRAASEEPVEQQTEFTVNLIKYADDSKIKLIKEVKALIEGLNLVQAKKFVEGVPQVVQKGVSKEEAEKLRAALEAAGGVVEIE